MQKFYQVIVITSFCFILSGCAYFERIGGHPHNDVVEQDFKPYIADQSQALASSSNPAAPRNDSWAYPAGTSSAAVIERWKQSELLMSFTRGTTRFPWEQGPLTALEAHVGSNFHLLSPESQKGFMRAVAQVYGIGIGNPGREVFLVMDANTGQGIGTYTSNGLQLY